MNAKLFTLRTTVLDFGNTQIKVAHFEKRNLIQHTVLTLEEGEKLNNILKTFNADKVIVASVIDLPESIAAVLSHYNCLTLSTADTLTLGDLRLEYQTPKTLGLDRLANAMALFQFFPGVDSLVIDLGTCIKFDLVTKDGVYKGGSISPGYEMRYKALHSFTNKLPLLKISEDLPALIGTDTESSIRSGVVHGITEELNGIINQYKAQYSYLNIVFTGGDAVYFAKQLKYSIFADNFLTLKGINEIALLQEHII
ncbi:MAG: type III pantothenate kinase [Luteibaculaceae bacterium]